MKTKRTYLAIRCATTAAAMVVGSSSSALACPFCFGAQETALVDGTQLGMLALLIVAIVKGSLVACYFMHLISEKKLIYAVLMLTVVFFVALLALPVITHRNGYWIH